MPEATYVLPAFATSYESLSGRPDAERVAYVASELRRLRADGAAILLAVCACNVDDEARTIALGMLSQNRAGFTFSGGLEPPGPTGDDLFEEPPVWRLRLKKGAVPPLFDPQGRRVPEVKAGKVLVAKVGTIARARGVDVSAAAALGQDVDRYTDVTFTERAFRFSDAVHILRRWGIGAQLRQYQRPRTWKPGDDASTHGQDQWLVEELPQPGTAKKAA